MSVQNRGVVVGLIAAVVLVTAAVGCGSQEPADGAGATSTTAAAERPATTAQSAEAGSGGAGSQSVTDYQRYVGGTPGQATKSPPITIGWINQEGGQQEVGAAATDGAEFAVKLINEELGGIDGHPLQLEKCFIRTAEEEGTTCAQKLGNDESVKLIATGGVAIGIQSFYSTIAGKKPVLVGVAATPVDSVQKNASILFGDAAKVLQPIGTYAKDVLHAKTAALVYPDIAGIADGAAGIAEGLTAAGVTVKKVGYSQGQADLIGPLTAAGAQTADIVALYSDASGCVNQAKALKQLGITDPKKIVSAPLCLNPTVAAGLGGDYPIWTYAIASSLFGDSLDPGMPAYMEATKKYGIKNAPDPWVIVSFGTVLTAAKLLNEVGPDDLTTSAILAKAKAFTGPVALGAPQLECGKYSDAPAVCNDRTQFFQYDGKNVFKRVAPWLQAPS